MPAKPRIIVLGGEGQLFRALARTGGEGDVLCLGRAAADVTDRGSVAEARPLRERGPMAW